MAPARIDEDPVTAEYDIFLTPALQEQIYLLQYPNRNREKPYNARFGAQPERMRIKPKSGYLELDVNLNSDHNFNKYQGLKWGDAMRTGREVQNDSATYGLASGFSGPKVASARRTVLRDAVDRELYVQNDLATFYYAQSENKVLQALTLGGQITKHDSPDEAGKPLYFVGAFRGSELHLTKVTGTVQMRPQFHHIDAEEQRSRLAASSEYAAAGTSSDGAEPLTSAAPSASRKNADQARVLHTTYKASTNPKGDLEEREHQMKVALQTAAEEPWTMLEYVDEDDDEAYTVWNERMFVGDTATCTKLQSGMNNEDYLDAISAPGRESPTRRRRRSQRRKEVLDLEDEDGEGGGG